MSKEILCEIIRYIPNGNVDLRMVWIPAHLVDHNAKVKLSCFPEDEEWSINEIQPASRDAIPLKWSSDEPLKPQPDHRKDVHTEHCCEEHKKCKYGKEDTCSVATGAKRASFKCNCELM